MTALFACVAVVYVLGMAARMALAARWFARSEPLSAAHAKVTVMIPVVSGDPALQACLRANLDNAPDATFLLMVESDDGEARRITADLARQTCDVLVVPPPATGENPKVAKLACALPHVATPLFAVLDDDTVLPPGAISEAVAALGTEPAKGGDLVTGLPVYETDGGFFTRLLAAFVNGSVLITYPVGALLGEQRTLNGMFYLGRTDDLRGLGGFEAIRGDLTDDYAMARLYLDAGRLLVQSRVVHPVRTTVTGFRHHVSVMRRWMIFARRYLRENPSPFTLGLIGGTTLAPLVLIGLACATGGWALALVVVLLAAKAVVLRRMRSTLMGSHEDPSQVPLEMLADVLTPLHMATTVFRPSAMRWRNRQIRMVGERITYE
ncbi:MAG: glycosyltransferase [Rhodobiaceae bacterium]|nr:glycosyltransferase [Rhodobiaceae bacterium]